MQNKIGFVCFGEINTPFERLQLKHDAAIKSLGALNAEIYDAGIVIDDSAYETAERAIAILKQHEFTSLILCVAGWVPTHAVIRVTDCFRHIPMVLWGLCGWIENCRIITTAEQAGTTALRPALEALGYTFKYIYNVIGEPEPIDEIDAYVRAAYAQKQLRSARVGTMGYRDMLLYGTQFEGNSMRGKIGVEVEPFEMLEMVQNLEKIDANKVADGVRFVRDNWTIVSECDDSIIETAVKYALAIGKKSRSAAIRPLRLLMLTA